MRQIFNSLIWLCSEFEDQVGWWQPVVLIRQNAFWELLENYDFFHWIYISGLAQFNNEWTVALQVETWKQKKNLIRNAVAREDVADSNSSEQILGCPLRESSQEFRAVRVLDF